MLWMTEVPVVIQIILLYVAISILCLTTVSFSYSGLGTKNIQHRVPFFMVKPTLDKSITHSHGRMISSTNTTIESALNFIQLTLQLKLTLRTGWVLRGIPHAESVADHSWHVALMCLFLLGPNSNLDVVKCVQMALIHDLAECIVGDITPCDTKVTTKEEKQKLETDAIHRIASFLDFSQDNGDNVSQSSTCNIKNQLLDLFHEYEERQSPEAIAVKDMDLLDLILQADVYETQHQQNHCNLEEFFFNTPPERFQSDIVRQYAKEVHQRRKCRWEAKNRVTMTEHQDSIQPGGNFKESDSIKLSVEDEAFVLEFTATSTDLSQDDIRSVVQSLRARDRVLGVNK